jgi:hypothetical protein
VPFKHLEGKLGPTHLESMRRAYDNVCANLKIGPEDPLATAVAAKITIVRLCVESMKLPRCKFRRRKGVVPIG